MKIRVEEIQNIEEAEIIIKCKNNDDFIASIIAHIELLDQVITIKKDGRMYRVILNDIFYFESVDNKVYAYTKNNVYEIDSKLYLLEDNLKKTVFLRVNKNTILNTAKIKSFTSTIHGKMIAKLSSNDEIIISRMYVQSLKMFLGGNQL